MKWQLITMLAVLPGYTVLAQTGSIKGTVTDAESGNPLSGAHIVIGGTRYGATSDYGGYYRISRLPDGENSVKATYIGYETSTLNLKTIEGVETVGDFKLIAKPYLAEEAIITANRVEVSRNITPMTVSLVNRDALENGGESNLLPIIGRQVPGMFVTERGITGFGVADGAAGRISIRGVGGSPITQVLVLIDGHPQFM